MSDDSNVWVTIGCTCLILMHMALIEEDATNLVLFSFAAVVSYLAMRRAFKDERRVKTKVVKGLEAVQNLVIKLNAGDAALAAHVLGAETDDWDTSLYLRVEAACVAYWNDLSADPCWEAMPDSGKAAQRRSMLRSMRSLGVKHRGRPV